MGFDDADSIEVDTAAQVVNGKALGVIQGQVDDIDRQGGRASAFACILYFSSFSEVLVAGEETGLYLKWSDEHIFSN